MAIIAGKDGHSHHQHIFGAVSKNGGVIYGEGFSVKKDREGTYKISFHNMFSGYPGVTCTNFGGSSQNANISVSVSEIEPSQFTCETTDPNRLEDSAFTFIAFGDVEHY